MTDFEKFINSLKAIGEFISLSSPVVIAWFIYKQHKIAKGQEKIVDKVDEYHKEVNGKMGLLLETTKELGERVGKEKEEKEQAEREKKPLKRK